MLSARPDPEPRIRAPECRDPHLKARWGETWASNTFAARPEGTGGWSQRSWTPPGPVAWSALCDGSRPRPQASASPSAALRQARPHHGRCEHPAGRVLLAAGHRHLPPTGGGMLAPRAPCAEGPAAQAGGELQPVGSQRAGHD